MNRRDLIRTAFLALVAAPVTPLLEDETTEQRKKRIVREMLDTPGGLRKLGEAMVRQGVPLIPGPWHLLYEHTIDWRSRLA